MEDEVANLRLNELNHLIGWVRQKEARHLNRGLKRAGSILGCTVGVLLILLGCYCLLWGIQSASFSVAAEPLASAIYQLRAEIMLPLGVLSIAIGALYLWTAPWSNSHDEGQNSE